jgi:hypothetical protein
MPFRRHGGTAFRHLGFEAGGDLEAQVAECRSAVAAGDRARTFQLEVWETTLRRIRKIETLMRDQQAPPGA